MEDAFQILQALNDKKLKHHYEKDPRQLSTIEDFPNTRKILHEILFWYHYYMILFFVEQEKKTQ